MPYKDGFKGDIELEYGLNEQQSKWELCLFHMNKSFLIKVTSLIKDYLASRIGENWIIRISQ